MRQSDRAIRVAGTRIDWDEVRRRLQQCRESLERASVLSPERKREILRARARALARAPGPGADALETLEVIEFVLADEHYGIEANHVREVIPLKGLTPLATVPPFVLGVVSVRGQLLAVLELRQLLELTGDNRGDYPLAIVLGRGAMEFGVAVNSVLGVHRVPLSAVQRARDGILGIRDQYLRGVTSERLVILDGAQLLADPQLIVRQ